MTQLERPQIVPHLSKQLTFSPFDVKWMPCSAKFVVLGQHARGKTKSQDSRKALVLFWCLSSTEKNSKWSMK